MNILLTTINSKYIHQNLAIRLLYALNKDFPGLNWREFINKDGVDEIASYCSNYQLVAFSCYIWNITKILAVATKIKLLNPDCKILLGGPEVSYEWQEIIELADIDYIIQGEGEVPFSSFLKSFPYLENVPALVWKKEGIVIQNSASCIFDLQHLEDINPYIYDSDEDLKTKICYIETSRGCPHTCEFCLAGLDNKVRYLPQKNIESNLLYLIENGKTIKFLDRTFNTNPKFAISIFNIILRNYKPGNIFQFEVKADILQNELIKFIREQVPKGIFRFEIGIQTLNSKSNKDVKRKQNFENIRKFVEKISDKVELHLDLIVGLPYDYLADIKYSFEEVFKLFAPELQLGFLKFLKGTPIRTNYQLHDYKFNHLPPYQIIESKYLSKAAINKITILEKALEIYWNKKRTIHTLKYIASNYAIFDFLQGLGKYFETKYGFGKYDLNEIYSGIYEYSKLNFPENDILPQLIALDYYQQYKVQPKTQFHQEIDRPLKYKILNDLHLNHNKFRFLVLSFNFNIKKYLEKNIVELADYLLIIQYNGVSLPQLIFCNE
ncbi:MAG: radical SAM protein [Bacteroidales bacterium]|nr:radical SAM protein [Bacteroidales bacterium]